MINKYHVISLCKFYEYRGDFLFLTLSCDAEHAKTRRKIRIAPKRFLYLNYHENEPIRILMSNSYKEMPILYDVICVNGVYDVGQTLIEIGIEFSNQNYFKWECIKKEYQSYIEEMMISEYASIKRHYICEHTYELSVLTPSEIEGINLPLKSLYIKGILSQEEKDVFEKILSGEKLGITDFFPIVDRQEPYKCISIYFHKLIFEMDGTHIKVEKYFSMGQKMSFAIRIDTVEFVSMFFSFVLKSVAQNRLLSSIEKYYVFD